MSRVFAYCRVSTADQTTDNQVREIAAAGFRVTPQRTITETVSGSVAASERVGFGRLMEKLEAADVLVVTKLDRLGRNAMDLRATVDALGKRGAAEQEAALRKANALPKGVARDDAISEAKALPVGVRVHCLALGGVDLNSSSGKMTMGVIAAVAEFERDLLIERTQAGLSRAKAEGKTLGRPQALQGRVLDDVRERLQKGEAVAAIARAHNTSRQTIMRIRDAAASV